MATATEEPRSLAPPSTGEPAQRFVLDAVSWDEYEALLKGLGDRPIRLTYDRGKVELMSPSAAHEEFGQLFGLAVQAMAEELDFPCRGLKSATWRREALSRGLEADECFYLASLGRVLGKKSLDLGRDPPPDLAIEIEVSRSVLDRLAIYAGLGVPEVWAFDGSRLRALLLQPEGTYIESDRSAALPFVPLADLARLVEQGAGGDHAQWGRRLRQWIRETLLPLYEAEGR